MSNGRRVRMTPASDIPQLPTPPGCTWQCPECERRFVVIIASEAGHRCPVKWMCWVAFVRVADDPTWEL